MITMSGFEHAILKLISQSRGPIGQGTLSLLLRGQGYTLSTPTVGRRLQELEFRRLVRKVSMDGRVLTATGLQALRQWDADAQLRSRQQSLLDTLKRGDKKHLLDLLTARRAIECEAVALAAEHVTPRSIKRMEQLLSEQAARVAAGELGIDQDVAFHHEIACASGNSILSSIVALLRNHDRYNFVITSMRAMVGSRLVVDHTAILDAIKQRNPTAARAAMEQHLGKIANDLERYWDRWVSEKQPAGRRDGHKR